MNINVTLIGQMITFAIFVGFTMKFVWPPLRNAMEERRHKIAEGLASADRAARELELAKRQSSEILREAREKSATIVENAYSRAHKIDEQAKENAFASAEKIKTVAMAEIEQEKVKAKAKLKNELADLAILAATKIISSEVNQKESKKILNDFISKV